MTIDTGLKPEGAPERSPITGEGAPSRRRCRTEALFGPTQDGGGGAFVAWRRVGIRRPGTECLCGQAERERDDREDEIVRLKSKVGEITMDNELLSAKIPVMEGQKPLGPKEVETMSQTVVALRLNVRQLIQCFQWPCFALK
jgi:hypothetical protein